MTISVKISTAFQELDALLEQIAETRASLVKKYPDIVVNVEVEIE